MISRRHWLMAGAGGAALGVGLYLGIRRHGDDVSPAASAPPASAQRADQNKVDGGESPLWSQHFERPEGGELALADLRGHPLVLNFWATWCAPCVREMPLLEAFFQAHRASGWQVVGLAIDGPTPVRDFLKRVHVSFPIGLAGLDGTELVRTLGNAQGGLPFSVLVGPQGQILARHTGEMAPDLLKAWRAQA